MQWIFLNFFLPDQPFTNILFHLFYQFIIFLYASLHNYIFIWIWVYACNLLNESVVVYVCTYIHTYICPLFMTFNIYFWRMKVFHITMEICNIVINLNTFLRGKIKHFKHVSRRFSFTYWHTPSYAVFVVNYLMSSITFHFPPVLYA